MIEPRSWMAALTERLRARFGPRLLYVGLQGSHRRGEAGPDSDIDVVAVLDRVGVADLDAYRAEVAAMPEGGKACGFVAGRDALAHWPRAELFAFRRDTEDLHGRLDDWLPPCNDDDAREGARAGAAALYHALAHGYLYGPADGRPAMLAAAFKAAFFVLRITHYLETGVFAESRRALADRLDGPERRIALRGAPAVGEPPPPSDPAEDAALLLDWCERVLRGGA